ncbi:MAG: FtsX-like permease family protein, partial [Nocardioidaceae bacterium]
MLRVAIRNLLARKVRMLSSALAVVLGIAFVAGSLVFTDTMQRSFDRIVEGSSPDVTVRPVDKSGDTVGVAPDSRSIPASVVEDLGDTPGAQRADGSIEGVGLYVLDPDGKLVGGLGAPTFSFNYNDAPATTGEPTVTIAEGAPPSGPDQVAIDTITAERAGFEIGDTVHLTSAGEVTRLTATLVGTAEFGGGGLAGATLVLFDTRTAQSIFLDGKDAYDSVSVTAQPGVSQQQLRDRVADRMPDGLEAVTGDVVIEETKDAIGPFLDFFGTVLLVFAAIAVVVGAFLIVNTFSILVAQRSRELALLRALGASRRQVIRSVLLEAVVVGLVGSTLGLLLGVALAAGLRALFGRFGLDLSETPLVLGARTVIVAYAVGVVVTVVAAYLPARRASRIAPVAAMRDDIALPEGTIRVRMIIGFVLAAVSIGLLVLGLLGEGNPGLSAVGAGVFGLLMAAALLSPVLGVPVLRVLDLVYRPVFGLVGRLATQNSLRNPRRTA